MSDENEEKSLTVASNPVLEQFKVYALQQGWDEKKVKFIADLIEVQGLGARYIEKSSPTYLELPADLQVLEQDPAFLSARPHGRLFYRELQEEWDPEKKKFVRCPMTFERSEVFDMIDQDIRPSDRRMAVLVPLAWRVGFTIGWLSGLVVVQPKEAREGLVILAALVRPLLSSSAHKQLAGGTQ